MNAPGFLHPDVEIVRLGPQSFLLYDAARDRRYQCGVRERWLLDRLDRNQAQSGIRDDFRRVFGRRLSNRELEAFVRHIHGLRLTEAPAPGRAPRPDPPPPPLPLSGQDPGAMCNHGFDWLVVLIGWILHPAWLLPLFAVSWVAMAGCMRHIDELLLQLATLFRQSLGSTLLLLILVRALTTLPRELLVGAACRRYGGRVRDFGLHWWYRIIPFFLCRISDPGNGDRGRRTLISIGLWFHLALFTASVMAWMLAPRPSLLSDVLALSVLVGFLGFLIRLNPLEHTPVYGLLCHRLQVHDLLPRALAATRAWLCFRPGPEPLSASERFWFRLYGLAVYLSRGLLVFLLGLLLWIRFAGVGLLLLAAFVLVWHHELSRRDRSSRAA